LRAHIQKEDGILYPMARARLPAEAMIDVSCRCNANDSGRSAEIERLHALANTLVARHPASAHAAPERACGPCA
jgi:hemerythrin-like domain-containing protein